MIIKFLSRLNSKRLTWLEFIHERSISCEFKKKQLMLIFWNFFLFFWQNVQFTFFVNERCSSLCELSTTFDSMSRHSSFLKSFLALYCRRYILHSKPFFFQTWQIFQKSDKNRIDSCIFKFLFLNWDHDLENHEKKIKHNQFIFFHENVSVVTMRETKFMNFSFFEFILSSIFKIFCFTSKLISINDFFEFFSSFKTMNWLTLSFMSMLSKSFESLIKFAAFLVDDFLNVVFVDENIWIFFWLNKMNILLVLLRIEFIYFVFLSLLSFESSIEYVVFF